MTRFKFQGRDAHGQTVQGIRESTTADNLGSQLIQEGIIPTKITEERAKRSIMSMLTAYDPVTNEERLIFCQQMAALLQAGIPLLRALQRVADTIKNARFQKIILEIAQNISEGKSLSVALQAYPKIFPPLFCNLVKVGEESGNLVEIFKELIEHLVFEDTTRKRIIQTIRYPATVIIFIGLSFFIINIFVIPVFARLYAGFGVKLPLPTRILISTSNFIRHDTVYLVAIIAILFIIYRIYSKTPKWKNFSGWLQLKLPIFGDIISRILLARFSRGLGLVYHAGIPLINGLQLVADSTPNMYARKQLLSLRDYLERGESLSAAATKVTIFSPVVIQMLTVGEETGSLDKILFQIASYYETTIDYDIKRLSDRIEPIMLIVVGGLVLLLALGIFLPMWNMVNVVRAR